ncbi:MAG: dihydroorotase [Bacteroidetes bacterium]|jgi:dihydroorotase|nr:dihydroorotase [Bacteroidota bacterium]MDF2451199.1 dihydroorotase [Bacteroidota bacterium]
MNVLIKQATLIDTTSSHHGKVVDILIEKGIIVQIKKSIQAEKGVKVIEGLDLHVSAGWLDMQVNFCDPGNEHKETLENGLRAAAKGGFTGVAVMSGTNPPLHNKAQIDYVVNKSRSNTVDVHPVGTLSHNQEGKDLSEMYDMQLSGAVGFSDYKKATKDAGLILRALQYSKNINSFIITHCDDKTISHDGLMNEGITSTRLGLKGMPALAEEIMLQRNIQILEYTGGRMHIPTISTKGSAELIRKAKARKLNITCGVAAYNLLLDDTAVEGFDTNFKVNPPLRTKDDIEALKKAVADGTIDVIVSDHNPQDIESKDLEFDHADNGMVGLESCFGVLNKALDKKVSLEQMVNTLTKNPRSVLGLKEVQVREGVEANLTLFNPEKKYVFEKSHVVSSNKNSGFIGKELKGEVLGVINKNTLIC